MQTSQTINELHPSFIRASYTCQASVSLLAPGAPLWWAALTKVEVTLIVIQGVVLRTDTGWPSAIGVDMTWVGGPHWGRQRVGLHGICGRHDLKSLGHAGGNGAVDCDLRDGLLGVLVLWLRCSLGFSIGHHSDCNQNYSHKSRLAGNNPHG